MVTMKRMLTGAGVAALFAAAPLSVQADPAAFLGLTYHFGGKIGVTAKILSSNKEHQGVAGLGGSYYFGTSSPWGLDVGAGYNFDHASVLGGWDFLQQQPSISAGWANTKHQSSPVVVAPPPA